MYEIETLKSKLLPELQEIAKKIGLKRAAGLKKLDLVYKIVDFIASKPDDTTAPPAPVAEAKKENIQNDKFTNSSYLVL
jgi:transcription termination factor Rho